MLDEPRRRFWLSFRLGFLPSVATLRSLVSCVGTRLTGSGGEDFVAAIARSSDFFNFLDLRPKGQKAISRSGSCSSSSPPLARRLLRRQHMRADSLRDLGDKSANHVALLMDVDLWEDSMSCAWLNVDHGAFFQRRKVHVKLGLRPGVL